MKTTDQKQLLIVGGCALAVLVILAGGYFMMISPKRAKAATLDRQVGETRAAIALAKATSQNPKNHDPRDLFRINKAMPDRVDMPGAILDLAAVGRATGVAIDGVQPFDPTPASSAGYESVPVTVTVAGKYGQITNFLAGLQHLVVLRHGQFRDARGRLFGVDAINFAAGDAGYPQIKATLKLETYVYAPAAPAPTDTTATTTTAQPDNLSAAGGTG